MCGSMPAVGDGPGPLARCDTRLLVADGDVLSLLLLLLLVLLNVWCLCAGKRVRAAVACSALYYHCRNLYAMHLHTHTSAHAALYVGVPGPTSVLTDTVNEVALSGVRSAH